MPYTLGLMLALLLGGCSKQVATCFDLGDNAQVNADFGYFYDSATFVLSGPAKFSRHPQDMPYNPCGTAQPPMSGGTP